MALYSLDNVPIHQNTSVRYERPVENTFTRNCVRFIMSLLSNVAKEIYIYHKSTYVIYLFHGNVIFPFSEEQKSTH